MKTEEMKKERMDLRNKELTENGWVDKRGK